MDLVRKGFRKLGDLEAGALGPLAHVTLFLGRHCPDFVFRQGIALIALIVRAMVAPDGLPSDLVLRLV